jgi:hypothetical protein
MRKFNTVKIMALGLAACALAAGAFAAEEAELIFDYNLTGKYWDAEKQKVSNYKQQSYLIWNAELGRWDKVLYWRDGAIKKYYVVALPDSSEFNFLDDVEKNVCFSENDVNHAANGFGTARRARGGQLSSLSVTGAGCIPGLFNGTVRVRFNKSLTNKAVKNKVSALDQVIAELERKGYVDIND